MVIITFLASAEISNFDWTGIIVASFAATISFIFALILHISSRRHQARMDERQTKITLFERRVAVRDAVTKALYSDDFSAELSEETKREFLKATKHARYLFHPDDKIVEFIDELYKKVMHLEYAWASANRDQTTQGIARNRAMDQVEELNEWFKQQREEVDNYFKPYLNLTE